MVESTQIRWFSRRSCGGGWSGRAVAQRRSRISKLGLNGLSDYYFNEIAVKAARLAGYRRVLHRPGEVKLDVTF